MRLSAIVAALLLAAPACAQSLPGSGLVPGTPGQPFFGIGNRTDAPWSIYPPAASGAAAPVYSWNFVAQGLDASNMTFARAGQATMVDAAGFVTYAPNQIWLNNASLSTQGVTTNGIANVLADCTTGSTGSVAFTGTATGTLTCPGNVVKSPTSGTLTSTVTGSVTNAHLAQVTYETSPRSGDQVATTAAAFYGPRFDYTGGSAQGMMLWGARTNLAFPSNPTTWTASGTTQSGTATGPDGVAGSAATIKETSLLVQHIIYNQINTTSGLNYTFTVYASQGVGRYLTITSSPSGTSGGIAATIDLSNGAITQSGATGTGATFVSASAVLVNGYWRLSVVGSNTSASTYFQVACTPTGTFAPSPAGVNVYTGTSTLTYNVFGAQVEQAAFASPYIPTSTGAATSAAETLTPAGALSTALAAGPWAYNWTDASTGSTACTTGAAGAWTQPNNGWLKSIKVYAPGTPGGQVVC